MTSRTTTLARLATIPLAAALALALLAAAPAQERGASPLQATFQAHGGLELWKQFKQYRFTVDGFPIKEGMTVTDTHLVDLDSRKIRIDGKDYKIFWNGQNAKVMPNANAFPGQPEQYATLPFRLNAMPFILSDPSAGIEPAGSATIDDASYEVFRVVLKKGAGQSPAEEYRIFIDPQSSRLKMLEYTITQAMGRGERTSGPATMRWAVYNDWQNVNGLQLAKRITIHEPGDEGRLGKIVGSYNVTSASLGKQVPPAKDFTPATEN